MTHYRSQVSLVKLAVKDDKMKSFLTKFFIPFALITTSLFAQNSDSLYTITGRVFNSQNNSPLVGTNIVIRGTFLGAATDLNGNFTIRNVPRTKKVLEVLHIGFKSTLLEVDLDSSVHKVFALIGLNEDNPKARFPSALKIDKAKTSKWETIELRSPFTFKLPKYLKLDKQYGYVDFAEARRYYSETMNVIFAYGMGVGPTQFELNMKDFSRTYWIIGCRAAEVVSYRKEDSIDGLRYHMSVYFGGGIEVALWINYKYEEDYETAKNILASIEFK